MYLVVFCLRKYWKEIQFLIVRFRIPTNWYSYVWCKIHKKNVLLCFCGRFKSVGLVMSFREIPTIRYLFCVHKKRPFTSFSAECCNGIRAGNTNFLKNNLLNLNPNSHWNDLMFFIKKNRFYKRLLAMKSILGIIDETS